MRVWIPLLLAAVILAVSGCAADPSAGEWANEVCTALGPWRTGINDLTSQANQAMSEQSTPQQAQEELLTLLAGAADTSQTAHDAVAEAGVPDVDDGAALAGRFTESLAATRDAYQSAHDDLSALDPADEGFYDDVAKVMDRLSSDYADVPQVAELTSAELADAFAQSPKCRLWVVIGRRDAYLTVVDGEHGAVWCGWRTLAHTRRTGRKVHRNPGCATRNGC